MAQLLIIRFISLLLIASKVSAPAGKGDIVSDIRADDDTATSREARSDDVSALEVLLQQHSQTISALEAKVAALQVKTDALANVVVYSARATTSSSPNHGDTVIFNHVVADVGHAYDVRSGTFLVPVSGVYAVFLRADPKEGSTLHLVLIVDNSTIDSVYGENSLETLALHLVLHKGSRLWVEYASGAEVEGATDLSIALLKPQ